MSRNSLKNRVDAILVVYNLTSEFEARLAAKDNEINSLRGDKGGPMPVTPEEMAAHKWQSSTVSEWV